MSTKPQTQPSRPVVLHFGPMLSRMSDEEFYEFCQRNREWRIERSDSGDLIIMPPTGGNTGRRNFSLTSQFGRWCETDGSGIGFDSSTGFRLPSGAERSPDLAWVRRDRWDALTDREREEFPPIAPDFVVELRSRTDSVVDLREKMLEYLNNGTSLGWLLDPYTRQAHIFRRGETPIVLDDPQTLSADPELPGFILNLASVW